MVVCLLLVALTAGVAVHSPDSMRASCPPPEAQDPAYNPFPNRDHRPIADAPFAPLPPVHDGFRPDRLESWIRAVDGHQAGQWDAEARRIAGVPPVSGWAVAQVAGALTDFESVRKRLARSHSNIAGTEFESLLLNVLRMTPEEIFRRDPSRIVKRAILLHTDIATLALAAQNQTDITSRTPLPALHFAAAWALTDALGDEFREEETVRAWYVATAAFLHSQRDIGSSPRFVRRAVARFSTDADLLFLAGAVSEFVGSARVQESAWVAEVRDRGVPFPSERDGLRQAERWYKQVLALKPSMAEARVHYGRVLGELGKREEAVTELRQATSGRESREILYLGWLFLGDNQGALGLRPQAEAAYRRAVALFPSAPSAHVALSYQARRHGDGRGARDSLLLEPGTGATDDTDPWDGYFDAGVTKQSQALLDALRRRLDGEEHR